jgi:hypothetical protein
MPIKMRTFIRNYSDQAIKSINQYPVPKVSITVVTLAIKRLVLGMTKIFVGKHHSGGNCAVVLDQPEGNC